MPSGKTHEVINFGVLPLVLTFYEQTYFLSFIFGYLFATFYLSPDLDLPQSRPFQRWGILRFIWIPYTKFKHRSIFTHFPIISSLIRVFYIGLILFVILNFVYGIIFVLFQTESLKLKEYFYYYFLSGEAISIKAIVIGVIIADMVHITLDFSITFFNKLRKWINKKFPILNL